MSHRQCGSGVRRRDRFSAAAVAGKEHPEARSLAHLAVRAHPASVILYVLCTVDRPSQFPCRPAQGEERFPDLLHDLRIDPASGIHHRQRHVATRRRIRRQFHRV